MATVRYLLYHSDDESSYTFIEDNPGQVARLLPADAKLIWQIEAESWEIACLKKHEFLEWEPYKPMIAGVEDLLDLIPKHKHDHDRFQLLQNLGYPVIAPVLPQLFEWIQDMNWPVAGKIAPYLASLGRVTEPQIAEIFAGADSMWKYWITVAVLDKMPEAEAAALMPLLKAQLTHLTKDDLANGVDAALRQLLQKLEGPRPDYFSKSL